jgi:Zn-dependent peptidase ImmA (M78 family)
MANSILNSLKIKEPPVPIDEIAEKKGAKLLFEPFDGNDEISGFLYRKDGTTIIGINSSHHQNRQRFSIAHELGHLMLNQDKELFVAKAVKINFRDKLSSMAVDEDEVAANSFAADILMPHDFIKNEIIKILDKREKITKEVLIDKLARKFHVSMQAMEYRLINLGFIMGE